MIDKRRRKHISIYTQCVVHKNSTQLTLFPFPEMNMSMWEKKIQFVDLRCGSLPRISIKCIHMRTKVQKQNILMELILFAKINLPHFFFLFFKRTTHKFNLIQVKFQSSKYIFTEKIQYLSMAKVPHHR